MDPVDSPRHVSAVTSRVDESRLVGLLAEGGAWSEAEVMAFVGDLPVSSRDGILDATPGVVSPA